MSLELVIHFLVLISVCRIACIVQSCLIGRAPAAAVSRVL